MRRRFAAAVVGLSAAATSVTAAAAVVAPAADAASAAHGCPYGAVCVYPHASWAGGPSYVFYAYGGHDIYNQYGSHRVYNHQSDNADVWFCAGAGGSGGYAKTNPLGFNATAYYYDVNLSPVNSLQLTPEPTLITQDGCQGGRTAR